MDGRVITTVLLFVLCSCQTDIVSASGVSDGNINVYALRFYMVQARAGVRYGGSLPF